MGWLLLIGLFCFLLVVGALIGKEPFSLAISSVVVLAALCFVAVVVFVIWALAHS
jgi:hypothetical protein